MENDQIRIVEENKQSELDRLEEEKQNLKKKENEILRQVDGLTTKIKGTFHPRITENSKRRAKANEKSSNDTK